MDPYNRGSDVGPKAPKRDDDESAEGEGTKTNTTQGALGDLLAGLQPSPVEASANAERALSAAMVGAAGAVQTGLRQLATARLSDGEYIVNDDQVIAMTRRYYSLLARLTDVGNVSARRQETGHKACRHTEHTDRLARRHADSHTLLRLSIDLHLTIGCLRRSLGTAPTFRCKLTRCFSRRRARCKGGGGGVENGGENAEKQQERMEAQQSQSPRSRALRTPLTNPLTNPHRIARAPGKHAWATGRPWLQTRAVGAPLQGWAWAVASRPLHISLRLALARCHGLIECSLFVLFSQTHRDTQIAR